MADFVNASDKEAKSQIERLLDRRAYQQVEMAPQDEELVALACLAISLTPNQAVELAEVNKVEN